MEKYDLIIIGGAAAGLSAAIYAVRRNINTLLITENTQGQTGTASTIENYPGFTSISGMELMMKFDEHARAVGTKIVYDRIQSLTKKDDLFEIKGTSETYLAKSVIISAGKSPKTMDVPGESNFSGKGVSYCATCDGPFFKEKIVAVIGGGNTALKESEYLSKVAKKVYLIHRGSEFRGEEKVIEHIKSTKSIEVIFDSIPKEILGKTKVESIVIENQLTKKEKTITIDGVFVSIGYVPKTEWINDIVKLDKQKHIIINEKCETSTKGIFAAGDITNTRDKQVVIAAAQGAIAALSVYDYLVGKSR